MQHVGIILYLFLFLVMSVYQDKELADNLETVFFFLSNIQTMACDACALNDETFQLYAQHFFLQVIRYGELFTEGVGNIIQCFLLCIV